MCNPYKVAVSCVVYCTNSTLFQPRIETARVALLLLIERKNKMSLFIFLKVLVMLHTPLFHEF